MERRVLVAEPNWGVGLVLIELINYQSSSDIHSTKILSPFKILGAKIATVTFYFTGDLKDLFGN